MRKILQDFLTKTELIFNSKDLHSHMTQGKKGKRQFVKLSALSSKFIGELIEVLQELKQEREKVEEVERFKNQQRRAEKGQELKQDKKQGDNIGKQPQEKQEREQPQEEQKGIIILPEVPKSNNEGYHKGKGENKQNRPITAPQGRDINKMIDKANNHLEQKGYSRNKHEGNNNR